MSHHAIVNRRAFVGGLVFLGCGGAGRGEASSAGNTDEKKVHKEIIVGAPAHDAFFAFATSEGVKTFFAPEGKVEPRVGGAFEIYFAPDAPLGLKGSEGCKILELAVDERLTFSWNFPPSLPAIRKEHTRVSVTFFKISDKQTRVLLDQTEFQDGADWEKGRQYFEHSWTVVLKRLQKRFESGPVDWSKE